MRSDSCFEQIALMSCETETVRRKNRNRKGSPGVTDSAQGGDPAAVGMQRGGWAQDTAQDAADRTCRWTGLGRGAGKGKMGIKANPVSA